MTSLPPLLPIKPTHSSKPLLLLLLNTLKNRKYSTPTAARIILPFQHCPDPATFSAEIYAKPAQFHRPTVFPRGFFRDKLPAFQKWVVPPPLSSSSLSSSTGKDDGAGEKERDEGIKLNIPYLLSKDPTYRVLVEMITTDSDGETRFEQEYIPFAFLLGYISSSSSSSSSSSGGGVKMYLAQQQPPEFLVEDLEPSPFGYLGMEVRPRQRPPSSIPPLPTSTSSSSSTTSTEPNLEEPTEKRKEIDIYSSSLWLGTPLTSKTPLHRDPNSNIFIQLFGRKRIRCFPPDVGDKLFEYTSELFSSSSSSNDNGSIRISSRGGGGKIRTPADLLIGSQSKFLEKVVWDDGYISAARGRDEREVRRLGGAGEECFEVGVEAGDAVFIPRGWWHAVHGVEKGWGGAVGSVNWWFR